MNVLKKKIIDFFGCFFFNSGGEKKSMITNLDHANLNYAF